MRITGVLARCTVICTVVSALVRMARSVHKICVVARVASGYKSVHELLSGKSE